MPKLYDIITPEEKAFRKTFSKKRRGRPQAFPDEKIVAMMPLRNGTWRGRMNELYRLRVFPVLFPEELTRADFEWIDGHKTVMYELGRVSSGEDARALFQQVRDANMTTRAAVAAIRAWRIGHPPPSSVGDLTKQIIKLLSRYAQTHPETTIEDLAQALERASDILHRHAPNDGL
jgi:hypothetical protein